MWYVVWLSYSQYQLSSVFCAPKLAYLHIDLKLPPLMCCIALYKNSALNWLCFYSFKPTVLHVHVFFLFSLLYILSICLSTILVSKCVHLYIFRRIAIFLWYVCLSVRSHISKTTISNFTKLSVCVACACGSVLLWRQCRMLRTSLIVDVVMFSCVGWQWVKSTEAIPRHTNNLILASWFTVARWQHDVVAQLGHNVCYLWCPSSVVCLDLLQCFETWLGNMTGWSTHNNLQVMVYLLETQTNLEQLLNDCVYNVCIVVCVHVQGHSGCNC